MMRSPAAWGHVDVRMAPAGQDPREAALAARVRPQTSSRVESRDWQAYRGQAVGSYGHWPRRTRRERRRSTASLSNFRLRIADVRLSAEIGATTRQPAGTCSGRTNSKSPWRGLQNPGRGCRSPPRPGRSRRKFHGVEQSRGVPRIRASRLERRGRSRIRTSDVRPAGPSRQPRDDRRHELKPSHNAPKMKGHERARGRKQSGKRAGPSLAAQHGDPATTIRQSLRPTSSCVRIECHARLSGDAG